MAEKNEQVTWYWGDKPEVMLGISCRGAGWMNADAVDLARGSIGKTNRDKFFAGINFGSERVVLAGLKHTTNIMAVDEAQAGQVVYGKDGIDGLSTSISNLILAVTVADCLPIYFYDSTMKVVAIAHAGWRGVLNNIAGTMVKHLCNHYSQVQPSNLLSLVGPCLRKCHFEVQPDIEELFKKKYSDYISYREGRIYVDLPAIVKFQLSQVGLLGGNIQDSGECTYDLPDRYFSFRRDKPVRAQSMVAFISLRNE